MKRTKLTTRGIAAAWLVLGGFNNLLATDRHVPADYATIQAAVNAAVSGDTIHIAPGVYVEQTFITNKNLTLIGQPGTILRAFPGMLPALPPVDNQRCILRIDDFSFVTIRDLIFEGDQLAGENAPELIGVNYDLSGGSVENCRFTGFREKTPGTAGGLAIKFWNGKSYASLYTANISGTTIEDSYSGIYLEGAPQLSYNFVISNNTIRGVGPNTTGAVLRGIQLERGSTGSVVGNYISGFSYVEDPEIPSPYPFGFGIIAVGGNPGGFTPLQPIRFENNTLWNNNLHMAIFEAQNHEGVNNLFKGTGPSRRMAGLWFSGDNVVVQGNAFEDMEVGIRATGVDPDFGTALGIADNATILNNRFCNVITNIEVQPMATATETGTLMCPFPDPKLMILSWPGIEAGFSVQSAPAPSGPWTTFDATPVRQNGENRVVVPATGDQRFFRLAKP